jgi:hypothetical protein
MIKRITVPIFQTLIDKSDWLPGEWMQEPDRVDWIDRETGYDCRIVREPSWGAFNGYVGVRPGHPLFLETADEIVARGIHAHRNVNHAAREDADEGPIWWFGFDCNHSCDLAPADYSRQRASFRKLIDQTANYKDLAYVWANCSILALQLRAYERSALRGRQ